MDINIIDKIITNIIRKCSNGEISAKLSQMSRIEKRKRLKSKMNPFEMEHYNGLYRNLAGDIDKLEEVLNDEKLKSHNGTFIKETRERIEEIKSSIFNYEKRIFRGYNLNKNKDNVSEYNLEDYARDMDNYNPVGEVEFGVIEQRQLDSQMNVSFNADEVGGLQGYFHHDSGEINGELNHNNKGLWGHLSQEERNEVHEKNKEKIKNIDSSIDKCPGLVQPTVLYTGVMHTNLINIHTMIGDKINMKSYISTSFQENVGKSYAGVGYDGYVNPSIPKLYVRFLAKEGTRGICANDLNNDLTRFPVEHEYLLDKNQSGTVVDIDYNTGCVTILLD